MTNDAASVMAAMLREVALFIEEQREELAKVRQDRDALRTVVESLTTELAVEKLKGHG